MGKENKIEPGSTKVEKDSLVKHLKGEQHKRAVDLQTKIRELKHINRML